MQRRALATLGLSVGAPLDARGRATRFEANNEAGARVELWRLDASDERIADRLLDLGAAGVGGFVQGGVDELGPWLVRGPLGSELAQRIRERKGAWPWREAAL